MSGVDFNTFYSRTEGVFPNLLLISDLNGCKFDGHITVSWDKKNIQKQTLKNFLFSIIKNKIYYQKHQNYSINILL